MIAESPSDGHQLQDVSARGDVALPCRIDVFISDGGSGEPEVQDASARASRLNATILQCRMADGPQEHAWRPRGLSKWVISRVIIRVTPFRVLITLLITHILSPLGLQVRMCSDSRSVHTHRLLSSSFLWFIF